MSERFVRSVSKQLLLVGNTFVLITTQKHVLRAELRNVVARFEQLIHTHRQYFGQVIAHSLFTSTAKHCYFRGLVCVYVSGRWLNGGFN